MLKCNVCAGENSVESFKDDELEVIEEFLTHVSFCKFHRDAVEDILKQKESKIE